MPRPTRLDSTTYKVFVPPLDVNIYLTISTHEGSITEVFCNSDHVESYQWISYFTRTISKRLQQGEHLLHLINEAASTFDTNGGYIIPKSKNTHVNSVVHHLGWVIQQHWKMLKRAA